MFQIFILFDGVVLNIFDDVLVFELDKELEIVFPSLFLLLQVDDFDGRQVSVFHVENFVD